MTEAEREFDRLQPIVAVISAMSAVKSSMNLLRRVISGAARRIATLLLRALPPLPRARVLEQVSDKMIAVVAIPGGQLRFYASTPLLLARAQSVLNKEPDMIQWLDSIAEGAVLWDIGANVGVFSLYAAVRRRARVLAFEPAAANFHVLSRNIQLNQLNEVTAYCVALSEATELGVLNLASPEMGMALSQFGKFGETSRYWTGGVAPAVQGMVGFAVDEFVARFTPPFPNYFKMDVDGLELPILRGAARTLRDPRLRSLMIELSLSNQEENSEAMHLLAEAGWKLVARGEPQGAAGESAANHFFERS